MKIKILLAITSLLTLACFGYSSYWSINEGTKFSRTMGDLSVFQDEGIHVTKFKDAWANPYHKVTSSIDGQTVVYMMSFGPDEKSASLGHDPDDITAWTRSDDWLESYLPYRIVTYFTVFFAGMTASLAMLMLFKGKQHSNISN